VSPPTEDYEGIARESGLSVADVHAIFRAYEGELSPRPVFPGVIQPHSLPFLITPVSRTARVIGPYVAPFVPFSGVIQAYYGIDVATGEQLGAGARTIMVVMDIVPVALTLPRFTGLSRAIVGETAALARGLRVHPRVLLPALGRLRGISSRLHGPLRSGYGKLRRGLGVGALTRSERAAITRVVGAAPDLAGPQAVSFARSQAPVRAARGLAPADTLRLRSLHPSLPDYLETRPRISLDPVTEKQLANIFATTGQSGGRYQAVRSASGELAVLEKIHAAPSTSSVMVLRPSNKLGDVTPDFAVNSTSRGRYHVETTTPTLAYRGQRGPSRGAGDSARPRPPMERTRPATSQEVLQAFNRKLDSGQISRSTPGVIVVNVQRAPAGPLLTAMQIQRLESRIASRAEVWELLVVVPGPQGRRVLRVGVRDSGLGLAEGALTVP
jgi:hypothetical protein